MRILLTFFLIFLPLISSAVTPAAQFVIPTSDAVQCLTFDEKGYMWIGTSSGLYSYDGYQFRLYRSSLQTPGTLVNNNVQSIATDRDCHLWVGTYDGLTCMDLRQGTMKHYHLKDNQQKIIYTLFTSSLGDVYAGTEGGLLRYDPKADSFVPVIKAKTMMTAMDGTRRPCGPMNVKAIAEDRSGNLYIGTWSKGLFRLSKKTGRIEQYAIPDNNIYSLCFDGQGRLWAGSWYTGLSLLTDVDSPRTVRQQKMAGSEGNRVYHIICDDASRHVWAVTPQYTYRFDTSRGTAADVLSSLDVLTSNTDSPYSFVAGNQRGTVVLSTLNRGLQIYRTIPSPLRLTPFVSRDASSKVGIVKTLCHISDSQILIGSLTSGVWSYNPLTSQLTPWSELPEFKGISPYVLQSSVTSITTDKQGNIWICNGYHGVAIHHKDGHDTMLNMQTCSAMDDNGVISSLTAKDGTVLLGQWSDIVVMPQRAPAYRIPVSDYIPGFYKGRVECLFQDCRGRIWACTRDNGVLCLEGDIRHRKSVRVTVFNRDNERFEAMGAIAMAESQGHKLRVLTAEGELLAYDEKKKSFADDGMNALMNESRLYAMQADADNTLWLAARNYLIHVVESKGKEPVIMRYYISGESDGIVIQQNAAMRVGNGLFFGGLNQMVSVNTRRLLKADIAQPMVSITDIRIDGVQYSLLDSAFRECISHEKPAYTTKLTIPNSVQHIDIDVSDLSFTDKGHVLYAYTLEGFHKQWYYCPQGDNSIRLYNLPSGTYTLLVRSTDSNGQWVDMPYRVTVRILPPWWATWWAMLIYLAVIGMAVYVAMQWYRRRIRTRSQLHIARVFTNITHELLTPIAVISASIETLRDIVPEQKYAVMQNNMSRLTRLIRQILEVQKVHSGNQRLEVERGELTEFLRALFENMKPLAMQKNIAMQMTVEGTPRSQTFYDSDKVDKIVYNLLSNAVKYTRDGGRVELSVKYLPQGRVAIAVADSGIGIMPQQMKNLYSRFMDGDYRKMKTMGTGIGLSLTHDLVKMHHGQIKCDSVPGRGTTFTVTIPVSRTSYTKEERGLAETPAIAELEIPNATASIETIAVVNDMKDELKEQRKKEYTVLLVEDNAELLSIMENALSPYYNILTAQNGRQALNVIQRNGLDIVVSDIMMPVMDGMELLRHLKDNEEYALLPIVLLTAKRHDDDRNAAYLAGVDEFLTKPFTVSDLRTRIDNIIRNRERIRNRFMKQTEFKPEAQHYSDPDTAFMERAVQIVKSHIDDETYTRDDFAKDLCMSSSALYKKLRALTGQNVTAFVTSIRMKEACRIMKQNPQIAITDLYCRVGYNSAAYFAKTFKKEFGMTPTEFIASLGKEEE